MQVISARVIMYNSNRKVKPADLD